MLQNIVYYITSLVVPMPCLWTVGAHKTNTWFGFDHDHDDVLFQVHVLYGGSEVSNQMQKPRQECKSYNINAFVTTRMHTGASS